MLIINAPFTAHSAPDDVTSEGRQFVEFLAKGDFAGAVARFDDTMKYALPESKLRVLWQDLETQNGRFQKQVGIRKIHSAGYEVALVTCKFERKILDVKVVFDIGGKVTGLFYFPSAGYVSDIPSYASTNTFREKELIVGRDEWQLPGTLTLPRNGTGPWPGVVLVHGSGPEDRDETGGANKPFRDLAWGLAAKGVAVLRYEKRTREYAAKFHEKYPAHFTVREETVDDAVSAVARLRDAKEIDPKRIFVLGHSMGGMLAPMIGKADTNIAGLILLAGATRHVDQVIVEQTRYLVSLDGAPSAEGEAHLARVESDVARIKALTAADVSSSVILFGAQPAYWLDLRGYDPLEAAKQLTQPLLILQGGRDYQVTQIDFNCWKQALGSRTNVTFKFYPKLNHQFIAGEGKSLPAEYDQAAHVVEPVIDDIAEWIKGHHN